MEKKQKRFYKVGETVWVISEKKEGKVVAIDTAEKKVTVDVSGEKLTVDLWGIDKLKYKAKEQQVKSRKAKNNGLPTVYFAKVREDAIIPSKREEDAGYDIYANGDPSKGHRRLIEDKEVIEIWCPAFTTTLVPTGIASAMPKSHYLNLKHERGSTGKVSMSVLAGVVDSGYRGEIFIALTPLHKDVLITSEVTETEVGDNVILYPYSKAIAQGTIDLVPQVHIEVIDFESLGKIESERGATKLGQSGK